MDRNTSKRGTKRKRAIQFVAKFSPTEYAEFIALHGKLYLDRSALVRLSVLGKSQKIVANVKGIMDTLDRLGPVIASSGEAIGQAAAIGHREEKNTLFRAQKLEELLDRHINLQTEMEGHMRKLINLLGNN